MTIDPLWLKVAEEKLPCECAPYPDGVHAHYCPARHRPIFAEELQKAYDEGWREGVEDVKYAEENP